MDDDKQITTLVEESKLVFLKQLFREFETRQAQYDLDKEFAKARKNRSALVPLVLVGVVVAFAITAMMLTLYIEEETSRVTIDVGADFADVNLRDVLDAAKRYEQDLDREQRNLRSLERERDGELDSARSAAERNLALLDSEDLSPAAREERAAEIEAALSATVAEVTARYEQTIAEKTAEIEGIQDKIAQYDARQLEQAREQERVLNNQQQLHDMEMERQRGAYEQELAALTESYEQRITDLEEFAVELERSLRRTHAEEMASLRAAHAQEVADLIVRFNPDVSDEAISSLIGVVASSEDPLRSYDPFLGAEGVLSSAEYDRLSTSLSDVSRLVARLREVTYVNSVPEILREIDARITDLVARFETIRAGLVEVVHQRDRVIGARNQTIAARDATIATRDETIAALNRTIQRYLYALEYLAFTGGEDAFIIDARDTSRIMVYVDDFIPVADGSTGYVFRRDDEFIGTIRFRTEGDHVFASLVDLDPEEELAPYDRILVQVQ